MKDDDPEDAVYLVPRAVLERLIACKIEVPACVLTDGDYCGEEYCPHGDGEDFICPECGSGGTAFGHHADDCAKLPLLRCLEIASPPSSPHRAEKAASSDTKRHEKPNDDAE